MHKGPHGLSRRGLGWARAAPDVPSDLEKVRFYKGFRTISDSFPHFAEMANLKMANPYKRAIVKVTMSCTFDTKSGT